jgi:putative ABC transport system permease protein
LPLTVVCTLALGIGASSAVFTAVNAVLLEPLPFPDADRLVSVRQTRERATVANVAPVRLEEWNERNSTFEALMGYTTQDAADTTADVPESIRVAGVSPRMIEVWGIEPILGRRFVAADQAPGSAPVALIAESLWERRFNRDPGVRHKRIFAAFKRSSPSSIQIPIAKSASTSSLSKRRQWAAFADPCGCSSAPCRCCC